MMTEIQSALELSNKVKGIISSFIEMRDFAKFTPQLNSLNSEIINLHGLIRTIQEREYSLSSEIEELRKENVRLKEWAINKEEYKRTQIATGVFAYIRKDAVGNFDEINKYCCNCFDKTIPSTLQQTREPQRMIGLVCPNGCPKLEFTHYVSPK